MITIIDMGKELTSIHDQRELWWSVEWNMLIHLHNDFLQQTNYGQENSKEIVGQKKLVRFGREGESLLNVVTVSGAFNVP